MTSCKTDLSAYLSQIMRYPLLSREEEIELARQSKLQGPTIAGYPLGKPAKDKLVCSCLRLVVCIAKRYRVHGTELDDLINAGNLGLERAARDYDPSVGRFTTYATWWVRNKIRDVVEGRYLVHVPKYLQAHILYPDRKHSQPAKQRCLEAGNEAMSIKNNIEIEGYFLSEIPAKEDVEPLETESLLEVLSPIERRIIELRFWERKTLQQIGEVLGVTKERVRQIQVIALKKLRRKYDE